MTATYGNDPAASPKDNVRFLLADTDESTALVSDEEIAAVLSSFPNPYEATAALARQLAMKFGRMPNKTLGRKTIDYQSISRRYSELATEMTKLASAGPSGRGAAIGPVVLVGGGGPTYLGPSAKPEEYGAQTDGS